MLAGNLHRLLAVTGRKHGVAVLPQIGHDGLPQRILILSNQYGLSPAQLRSLLDMLGGLRLLRHGREVDAEVGATVEFTLQADVAAALLHDAVDHAEAQPRPFAQRLGGKKWLEDA